MTLPKVLCLLLTLLCVTAPSFAKDFISYFPNGVLSHYQNIDALKLKWYNEQLSALHEPSLFPPEPGTTSFRFLWLRTFHNPMSFRITILRDGSGVLAVKRADGKGGYEPGKLIVEKEFSLAKDTVNKLVPISTNGTFWLIPTEEPPTNGLDGAQWVFEATDGLLYHVVDRWGGGELQNIGLGLIKASGESVGDIY